MDYPWLFKRGALIGSETTVHRLTLDTPVPIDFAYGKELEIACGDTFCVVTNEASAVVLSRPSKEFDISFERGLTTKPTDPLSKFIVALTTELTKE